ncbi:uncharacterized protein TNCV_1391601 [Trichonephila clavipes]|nr:uncharacterized protein TNCV_1391601 [Trichonephila clavipes]
MGGAISKDSKVTFENAKEIGREMVPINRRSATVPLNRKRSIHAERNHFPLKPTILDNSQSQQGTFDEIAYKYSKAHSQLLIYVILSKVIWLK